MILDGFTQSHVTEREIAHSSPCGYDDAAWEDCTFCAGLEWWRATGHPTTPATHDEAEHLRCASGRKPTGGTSIFDLRVAIAKRYGVAVSPPKTGYTPIWLALQPGFCAVVQGSMAAFPQGSWWRRWDAGFAGNHAAFVARPDAWDRVWWCDPLAPEGTGYQGEWMSRIDFRKFVMALPFPAQALVGGLVADPIVSHVLHIAAGTKQILTANLVGDRIESWTITTWSGIASTAPCGPAVVKAGTHSGSATVAFVTAGVYKGKWVRISPPNGTSVV